MASGSESTALGTSGINDRHQHHVMTDHLSSYHDNNKLDLVLVIDASQTYLEKYFGVLCRHYKHVVKRLRKKTKLLRVSVVAFRDPIISDEQTQATDVHISNFTSSSEELSEIFSKHLEDFKRRIYTTKITSKKTTEGLAFALAKVSDLTFRKNANKVCVILVPPFHSTSEEGSSQLDSPHSHDIVKLSRLLASKGVSLNFIGCVPHNIRLISTSSRITRNVGNRSRCSYQEAAYLHSSQLATNGGPYYCTTAELETLSLITGGRYVAIFSTSLLTELIISLIEEDLSIERAVGHINDHIIMEVYHQFNDVNINHLATTLCKYFTQLVEKQCNDIKFCHLMMNGSPADPPCEFAERLSFASSVEEMNEISRGKVHEQHPVVNLASVEICQDGVISEKEAMRMVHRLIARMDHIV